MGNRFRGAKPVRLGRKYSWCATLAVLADLCKVICNGRRFRNYVLRVLQAIPQMALIRWVLCGCAEPSMVFTVAFSVRDDFRLRFCILFILSLYVQVRCRDGSAFPAFLASKGLILLTYTLTPSPCLCLTFFVSFLLTNGDGVEGSMWLNIESDWYIRAESLALIQRGGFPMILSKMSKP